MKPKFILIPDNVIADIGKVGSTTIFRAVLETYHPDRVPITLGADISNSPDNGGRGRVDRTDNPTAPVLLPVRDPIERFRSACSQSRIDDVDVLLTHLEEGTGEIGPKKTPIIESYHFRPQVDYRNSNQPMKLYKFPEHIDDLATEAGLPTPMPTVNDSISNNPPKPDLTPAQLTRVESIYAEDILLFNSITAAGQDYNFTYVEPPIPATDADKAAKISELEAARYQAEIAGVTLPDGKEVRTDKTTQEELGKALSIIATVNPALEIDWKFPSGEVVHLDATAIQQIAGVVFAHVQVTRTTYKNKASLVAAATTTAELNAITW